MTRILEIKTPNAEPLLLPLITEDEELLTMARLQTIAATVLPEDTDLLRCTDSDGDHVTITIDADVKELDKYMQGEQMQRLQVLVVPAERTATQSAANTVQTQLRSLVTAMSKLTAKLETKPTPTSAMNVMLTSVQAMEIGENAEELATIKKELLLVLQDEAFRGAVKELRASEEFKT